MRPFRSFWRLLTAGRYRERIEFAFSVCLQDPTLYPLNVHPVFDAELCERMFMRNQAMLHAYVKSNGGRALTCLPPCNGFGRRAMSRYDSANVAHLRRRVCTDGVTELDATYDFCRRVVDECRRRARGDFIDMTAVFDQQRSDVYIDQVHCSDVGNDLIARRIADEIMAREAAAD